MKFVLVLVALVGVSMAVPTRTLDDDFKDILATLPLADMRAVARKYLASDAELQRVVKYLQGDDWAALVAAVAGNSSYQKLKTYLIESGVDVDAIVQFLHDLIQNAQIGKQATRSMREFLDEIKALVDVEKVLGVVNNKLETSPDFIEFYVKISSEEGHKLFEEVRQLPEVQRIAGVLREMGVDLDKVIDLIYSFLGWE